MYGCVFKVPSANIVNLVNALGFIELSVKGGYTSTATETQTHTRSTIFVQ